MPVLFLEHAYSYDTGAGELFESAIDAACNTLSTLPRGTSITIGMTGTYGGVGGGPALLRAKVSTSSGHYSISRRGWDPIGTRALIVGWVLSDAVLRKLEIELILQAQRMPNIFVVEGSNGGGGPQTNGPVRVIYFNRLQHGVDEVFVREAVLAEKKSPT